MNSLAGVLPVLHMPYRDDDKIDFDALGREIDFAYECGADGIVLAMVTELLRLTHEERREVAAFFGQNSKGRGSITISVGAESTLEAVELARHAEESGATALMAIPPIATALGERELRAYFGAILGAVDIPLVVQDASGYVGRPMTAEFQASLWTEYGDRVAFKPEAAPVGPVISRINEITGGKARVFEGSGGSYLVESYRRSIAGTMPGTDLLDAIVALWRALEAGDEDRVYAISPLITAILALAVGLDGYLAIEKHLMHKRGLFPNKKVRGPVSFTLDDKTTAEVDRLYDRLQAAVHGAKA